MDQQIKRDWHPRNSGRAEQLGIAEQRGGAMVVRVKKGQRLLLQHKKQGVSELDIFGDVVQLRSQASQCSSAREK